LLHKGPHLLEPSHPPGYGPSSGPIGLCPPQSLNLCPCFLPVNSVDGCKGLFPLVGRRLGVSHCAGFLGYMSSSLTDVLQRNRFRDPIGVIGCSPYSASRFPQGEKGQVLWINSDRESPVSSKAFGHDQRT
jgi:hypothetical protein